MADMVTIEKLLKTSMLNNMNNETFIGAILMAGFFFLFIFAAFYIFFAFVFMALVKKTRTENAWHAWIPILNLFLMVRIAKLQWWWGLIFILTMFLPGIGGLVAMILSVFIWWKISEAVGKPGYWGVLMMLPFVNIVLICIMAWGK